MYSHVLVVFVLCIVVVLSLSGTQQCGRNEIPSTTKDARNGKIIVEDSRCDHVSTLACDSCKDCSACFCQVGYIREAAGGQCISNSACQQLHVKWLAEKKNSGTNHFCTYKPARHV